MAIMPYVSQKQRRFFHTVTARQQGITAAEVHEFDEASKGMKLPEKAKKHKRHVIDAAIRGNAKR